MKYRSNYRNVDAPQTKIRSATKETLLNCLSGEIYFRNILIKLGISNPQTWLNKILVKAFHDNNIDISHLPHKRREDLTGQKFGHLFVLRMGQTLKCGNTTWICREEETGIEKPVLTKHLKSGASKSFSFSIKRGEDHCQWGGYRQISGTRWTSIKRQAETRKLEFSITIEFAWDLYLKQNRKCSLSGLEIYFAESTNCPYTASLDRIDNNKGYTEDNIQWVHSKINIMKNVYSQEDFIKLCKAVAKTQGQ